jgi:hypothetical protein
MSEMIARGADGIADSLVGGNGCGLRAVVPGIYDKVVIAGEVSFQYAFENDIQQN